MEDESWNVHFAVCVSKTYPVLMLLDYRTHLHLLFINPHPNTSMCHMFPSDTK